jgi:hexosaminidase
MPHLPALLPQPKQIAFADGTYSVPDHGLLLAPRPLYAEAKRLRDILRFHWWNFDIVAHSGGEPAEIRLIHDAGIAHREGYTLVIGADGIAIYASSSAGVMYAVFTLKQLFRVYGRELPCMQIDDAPDFAVRGVMLDISRDRVPRTETLTLLIERLAAWKINQVQLYMEHTYAYRAHPDVWRDATPLGGADVIELDALCKSYHIELVPNQNSFGHMERWLKHARYADLANSPDGFTLPWGDSSPPTSLNPLDPRSIDLIAGLYDELLPHFSSLLINVGGDEPWELGLDRTAEACETDGEGRVYLDYVLKLHDAVSQRKHQMMLWGDIIIKYPELVPELPDNVIALDWGYESTHDFDGHAKIYADAEIPFYLCAGTSAWNSLVGRVDNMLGNLNAAAQAGLAHGAIGVLTTEWGDNGHWQPFAITLMGFAAGAIYGWTAEQGSTLTAESLAPLLDAHLYEIGDADRGLGEHAVALGNLYLLTKLDHINGNVLAYALQQPFANFPNALKHWEAWNGSKADITPKTLRAILAEIDAITPKITKAHIGAEDAGVIRAELNHAAMMLAHGAKRLLFMQGEPDFTADQLLAEWDSLATRQQSLWLARSRSGGLADSIKRFQVARADYLPQA